MEALNLKAFNALPAVRDLRQAQYILRMFDAHANTMDPEQYKMQLVWAAAAAHLDTRVVEIAAREIGRQAAEQQLGMAA